MAPSQVMKTFSKVSNYLGNAALQPCLRQGSCLALTDASSTLHKGHFEQGSISSTQCRRRWHKLVLEHEIDVPDAQHLELVSLTLILVSSASDLTYRSLHVMMKGKLL